MQTNTPEAAFKVGSIPIFGDLILAPMDGYSNLPFRSVARELGSAMSYTEFINGMDVVLGRKNLGYKIRFLEKERPLVFQLYDDQVDRLVQAAHKLMALQPDIIDINMGCSAKKIAARGAGAGLLQDPDKIADIFSRLSSELDIPVTGKIRLGWDEETLNYLEISKIIEDNGGALVAVHGRTREQRYRGQANWKAIAEIKQQVRIPVIGNGDVRSVSDIEKMKAQTGCDGVMIGRGATKNPWIFARMDRQQVPDEMVIDTINKQMERSLDFYGPERGLILMRKYISRYLEPYEIPVKLRKEMLTSLDQQVLFRHLENIILEDGYAEQD